jgi:hypothetical protein
VSVVGWGLLAPNLVSPTVSRQSNDADDANDADHPPAPTPPLWRQTTDLRPPFAFAANLVGAAVGAVIAGQSWRTTAATSAT